MAGGGVAHPRVAKALYWLMASKYVACRGSLAPTKCVHSVSVCSAVPVSPKYKSPYCVSSPYPTPHTTPSGSSPRTAMLRCVAAKASHHDRPSSRWVVLPVILYLGAWRRRREEQ